jgi:murein L,D-transpeptidase YafK
MRSLLLPLLWCIAGVAPLPAQQPQPAPAAPPVPADQEDRVAAARTRTGKAVAELCTTVGVTYPPRELFLRGFKAEQILEAWARSDDGPFRLVATWPVLAASGLPGPKRMEGDLQVPEGCYQVVDRNPKSLFHLSLGLDYPNASDRVRSDPGKPGFDIYLHGGNQSVGCMAIGDERVEELYLLAADVRLKDVAVHLFPTRMQGAPWDSMRTTYPQHAAFWAELQPIYETFERTRLLPKVTIDPSGAYRLAP